MALWQEEEATAVRKVDAGLEDPSPHTTVSSSWTAFFVLPDPGSLARGLATARPVARPYEARRCVL